MRWDIVRHDQYGRLATAHEITRHCENEVGVGPEHLRHEFFDRLLCGVRPAFQKFRSPARHTAVVEDIGHLWPEPYRLRRYACDDTIGSPLQKVPDEWTSDAESEDHEPVYSEVIHQPEMVIGEGIPRLVDLKRAGGLTAISVAQVREHTTVLSLELVDRVEGHGG